MGMAQADVSHPRTVPLGQFETHNPKRQWSYDMSLFEKGQVPSPSTLVTKQDEGQVQNKCLLLPLQVLPTKRTFPSFLLCKDGLIKAYQDQSVERPTLLEILCPPSVPPACALALPVKKN